MGDLVLDTIRQTIIKVVPEGTFSIAPDLHHNLVELDHILGDTLTVLCGQVVELVLHISDRVIQTKVHLEFQDELLVVFHPEWMEVGVVHEEKVWFELLQSDTFEVGLCKGDFGMVLGECLRAILEVQLVLHEEDCYAWASVASEVKGSRYKEDLHLVGSRGFYTGDFPR